MAEKVKKPNKFLSFLKRNLALVIIIACILAIVAIIIAESVSTVQQPALPDIEIGGGGMTDADDNDNDNNDTQTGGDVITFEAPMADFTVATDFTEGDDFVYSASMEEWTTHRGMDLVAKGDLSVRAVADGTVESVTTDDENGTKIVIDHGNGLKSIYASLTNPAVKQGAKVAKGDKIGEASDAGYLEYKQGPHVHFEMTKDGKHVSPREYLEIK